MCMISSCYTKYPSILPKCALVAACLILCNCSMTSDISESDQANTPKRAEKISQAISSQFEWAVQYYEAGNYEKAIKEFNRLQKKGAAVPSYELIPYYLGMSHFHLKENDRAIAFLNQFVNQNKNSARLEDQEARITLLLAYESTGQWDQITSLASDTDKLNLFQENRALMKLVWARALREKGELMGARAVLKDASSFLENMPDSGVDRSLIHEPNRDTWGRYYFTMMFNQEKECADLTPREFKKGKSSTFLYAPWLEGETDCLKSIIRTGSDQIFRQESPWSEQALEVIERSLLKFEEKIHAALRRESKKLPVKIELQKESRKQLYRLMSQVEDSLKNFKIQGVKAQPLEQLRKRIDLLIVSL